MWFKHNAEKNYCFSFLVSCFLEYPCDNSADSLGMLCTTILHNRGTQVPHVDTLSVLLIDADLASLVRFSLLQEVGGQLYFSNQFCGSPQNMTPMLISRTQVGA